MLGHSVEVMVERRKRKGTSEVGCFLGVCYWMHRWGGKGGGKGCG